MSRKLASIRTVSELRPIPGADLIELAVVDGWQCVVKKGEFKPSDACVFYEIDSVLPIKPCYEFLRKGCHRRADWLPGGEGFRIKTVKLRGQLSQGLALRPSDVTDEVGFPHGQPIGADVTEGLDVVLWDPPVHASLRGQARGNFPSFIPKTDQERVQNCFGRIRHNYGDHPFEVTVKLDGSSCTIYTKDGLLGVCSRNLELKLEQEGNAFVNTAKQVGPGILSLGRNLAFQGELMGPGIQGNRENFPAPRFFVFDIWDIDNQQYLPSAERVALTASAGLQHVPVISTERYIGSLDAQDLLRAADETPSINNSVAEGLVFKSTRDPSIHFKVVANRFLLGEKD